MKKSNDVEKEVTNTLSTSDKLRIEMDAKQQTKADSDDAFSDKNARYEYMKVMCKHYKIKNVALFKGLGLYRGLKLLLFFQYVSTFEHLNRKIHKLFNCKNRVRIESVNK
ncbi:hypothetical protein EZS27_026084 [termite gut metagenome]|uniref:Uncharacterized protein n=1 Tax=termite gut metagenome TaxID=433724 RepID=A0A5J4QUQ5_9ZZZZ